MAIPRTSDQALPEVPLEQHAYDQQNHDYRLYLYLRVILNARMVDCVLTRLADYAIASGMLLATVNYVIVGLFNSEIHHIYLPSWGIWVSLVVVFNGFASVAFSMVRH